MSSYTGIFGWGTARSVISTFSWGTINFFKSFNATGLLKNLKKQHFICSNLTLFSSFLSSFFSFFLFFLFFFLFIFPPSRRPPASLKWRLWVRSILFERTKWKNSHYCYSKKIGKYSLAHLWKHQYFLFLVSSFLFLLLIQHTSWLYGVVLLWFLREIKDKQRWARLVHGWVTIAEIRRTVGTS